MSDNTTTKPEARTEADARREFACASEPARRRIAQTARPSDQFTIASQASLLDCIADRATAIRNVAFGNAVIAHASVLDLIADTPPARAGMQLGPSRRKLADGDFVDLPDDDSPFHCRRCSRKFQPGQLDYFTGMCAECDEKTAVQLHR